MTLAADKRAPVVFGAAAWGSQVQVAGPLAGSGRSALAVLGCTRKVGASSVNGSAGAEVVGLVDTGEIITRTMSSETGSAYVSTGRTELATVSLLGSTVVAQGVVTTARAREEDGRYRAGSAVTIAHLEVNGTEIDVEGAEQVVDIAGVGTLTIAKDDSRRSSERAEASGHALELRLLDRTVIRVGSARASVDGRAPDARFAGGAFGTSARVGAEVQAGRTAVQPLPCVGTDGADRSNSSAGSDLGDLGEVGAVTSTVNAAQGGEPEATVTNVVEDVSLDLGVAELRLEGVVTEVHAVRVGGKVMTDLGSSSVGSLVVNPIALPPIEVDIPVEPNSVVQLPLGLGSATFFQTESLRNGRGLGVIGVELKLADTHVTVGSARGIIRR